MMNSKQSISKQNNPASKDRSARPVRANPYHLPITGLHRYIGNRHYTTLMRTNLQMSTLNDPAENQADLMSGQVLYQPTMHTDGEKQRPTEL